MSRRTQKEMLEDYDRLTKEHEKFAGSLTWQYGVKWISWKIFYIVIFSGLSYLITILLGI